MTETANYDVWIVSAPGLERVLGAELRALGVQGPLATERGGVGVQLDDRMLARVVLRSRVAESVRVAVLDANAPDERRLARHLGRVAWAQWLGAPYDLRVDASAKKSRLHHTGMLEGRVVEAIGAACRGVRVAGDPEQAKLRAFIRMDHDRCVVRVEVGRPRLHRRGWRAAVGVASLRETVASAVLQAAGWRPPSAGEATLADPCCGAGTLLLEAASLASGAPPRRDGPILLEGVAARSRGSALAEAWAVESRAAAADASASPASGAAERATPQATLRLIGSDRDPDAIAAARANDADLGAIAGAGAMHIERRFALAPLHEAIAALPVGSDVVCNLPWGKRTDDDAYVTMRRLAGALRARRDLGLVAVLDGSGRARDAGLRGRVALRMEQGGTNVSLLILRERAEARGGR